VHQQYEQLRFSQPIDPQKYKFRLQEAKPQHDLNFILKNLSNGRLGI